LSLATYRAECKERFDCTLVCSICASKCLYWALFIHCVNKAKGYQRRPVPESYHFGAFQRSVTLLRLKDQSLMFGIVLLPKDFKGMDESTYLSRAFSDQGVRLRLRKEPRAMMFAYHHVYTEQPY
jgi:hypothetical protein